MSRRTQLALPSNAALSHTLRIPSNSPDASKALSKLSRASLIDLALTWLQPSHRSLCEPFIRTGTPEEDEDEDEDEEDMPYLPARSVEELEETWKQLASRSGGRRELVERILEGDWRHGLTLYQLAMAETRYLLDHQTAFKWAAMRLSLLHGDEQAHASSSADQHLPRFHAQTFLLNLHRHLSPVLKAHYYLTRIKSLPVTLLRLQFHDTPYGAQRSSRAGSATIAHAFTNAKSMFVMFPDGSPYVYLSLATGAGSSSKVDGLSLRNLVTEAISKALSRPGIRHALKSAALSARLLKTMLTLRGPGRSNAAAGGWSIFHDSSSSYPNALDFSSSSTAYPPSAQPGATSPASATLARNKALAEGRFGASALELDGCGLERLDVRVRDPFPDPRPPGGKGEKAHVSRAADPANQTTEPWTPDVRISFQGAHVFAGLRLLVEGGVIDGARLPGWMTGEAGISVGVVEGGKVVSSGG